MTGGSPPTTRRWASPRSCWASFPAVGGRSGWPGSSARPGRRTWSSRAGSCAPTRRSRSAWSTSWSLRPTSTPGARAYVEPFAHGPALAYAAAKKAIDGGLDVDLRTGLDIESDQFAGLFATDDQRMGMASFVEHGPGKAKFTGR